MISDRETSKNKLSVPEGVERVYPRTSSPIATWLRTNRESSADHQRALYLGKRIQALEKEIGRVSRRGCSDVSIKVPACPQHHHDAKKFDAKKEKFPKEAGNENKADDRPGDLWTPPHAVYNYKRYNVRPAKIEDYEPGKSSIAAQEPSVAFSSNFLVEKPGDNCRYIENVSSEEYLIQKSNRTSTPDLSGRKLYLDVQRGGEIPLSGLSHKMHSRGFIFPVRRHSNASIFYPRSLSESRPDSEKKNARPCLVASPQIDKFLSPSVNMSLSALLSCANSDLKDRKSRDEINSARKKEMEIVLKTLKERKKMLETEETKAKRHADTCFCISPVAMDRYDIYEEEGHSAWTNSIQSKPRARVLYNFYAQHPRELSLRKDDVVYVWRTVDNNWLEVEHHGAIGLLPMSYVKFLDPNERGPREKMARVKFDFNAHLTREMSVKKGDYVVVLGSLDTNWVVVERKGKVGILPLSYLELENCDPDENKTSDRHSTADSTIPSESISTESLLKCDCTTPASVSPSTKTQLERFSATLTKAPPNDNLSSPQEANKSALDLLPYVECVAMQPYRPQEIDELLLKVGDVVHVTETFNDGWFVGISLRTKQCGTFPGVCVQKL